ncbi:Polyphosphate kinase [Orchesella cincta]|uniref:Polyphosphate kinase n=1 Tax=Orchesella cincta TaxID=48709 RepID=A0A1D2MV39_ORCCI|nr:Polyphosphate kinase [Orchesella cincta]
MKKLVVYLLIGVVLSILTYTKAQEVSIYGGRAQIPLGEGGGEGGGDGDGSNDEVQDESELASALGIDRQALYEDLMRIQEELGGSPLAALAGGGDAPQSQEQEEY